MVNVNYDQSLDLVVEIIPDRIIGIYDGSQKGIIFLKIVLMRDIVICHRNEFFKNKVENWLIPGSTASVIGICVHIITVDNGHPMSIHSSNYFTSHPCPTATPHHQNMFYSGHDPAN